MANKKSKKEPFQWERFIAAKKRAKISITKLGSKDDGIGWSEKTPTSKGGWRNKSGNIRSTGKTTGH